MAFDCGNEEKLISMGVLGEFCQFRLAELTADQQQSVYEELLEWHLRLR